MLENRTAWWLPWLGALLLLSCSGRSSRQVPEDPQALVRWRVTGTLERKTLALVRIEIEDELFVVTPEHPFAAPGRGWIPAGRLAPGDWVLSAKYGRVRVSSVRREQAKSPAPVFNLSVDGSHAYLVGVGQVLVHNTKCKDPREKLAELAREIEEATHKLNALREADPKSAEIFKLTELIAKNRKAARSIRYRQSLRGNPIPQKGKQKSDAFVPGEDAIARNTRRAEEARREIKSLTEEKKTASPERKAEINERLAELRRQRNSAAESLRVLRKKEHDAPEPSREEKQLAKDEASRDAARTALENGRSAWHAALEEQARSRGLQKETHAERVKLLDENVRKLQREYDDLNQIVVLGEQIAKLAEQLPQSTERAAQIANEKRQLRAQITTLRVYVAQRKTYRKKSQDPVWMARQREVNRRAWQRMREKHRGATNAEPANAGPPRDGIALLQEELEAVRREPSSPDRDNRIELLGQHLQTLREINGLNRQIRKLLMQETKARREREELTKKGLDTREIDQTLARLEQQLAERRTERVAARARAALLGALDGQRWWSDSHAEVTDSRLRELEAEIAGSVLGEERLRELEQELGEPELITPEFMEELWRAAELEPPATDAEAQQRVQEESQDVDAAQAELAEIVHTPASPERDAAARSALRNLQHELNEERRAVEQAKFLLTNEYAAALSTLGGPGSSHYAERAQRVESFRQRLLALSAEWRQNMRERLNEAQRLLRDMQSNPAFRDETMEAELSAKIGLLQYEVNNPSF